MVGEGDVGGDPLNDLGDGGDVGPQVGRQLRVVEQGEEPGLEALVGVGDVDGQQPADVGAVGGDARRLAQRGDAQRAGVPVAERVDDVQFAGAMVLAE